jgi:hypothetical protein
MRRNGCDKDDRLRARSYVRFLRCARAALRGEPAKHVARARDTRPGVLQGFRKQGNVLVGKHGGKKQNKVQGGGFFSVVV